MIIARLRDVNDRVADALSRHDLRSAVVLARADTNSLRIYKYSDLLQGYLLNLLDRRQGIEYEQDNVSIFAAQECKLFIGIDPLLWEFWINKFIQFKQVNKNNNTKLFFY
jgi:hypothetical protein